MFPGRPKTQGASSTSSGFVELMPTNAVAANFLFMASEATKMRGSTPSVPNDAKSFVEVVMPTNPFAPRYNGALVVKKTRAPVVSAGEDAPSKNNDDVETVSSPALSNSESGVMHIIRKICYGHGLVGLAALETILGITE